MNKTPDQIRFECVVQNLRRASRLVSRRYEDALRPVNLTSSQFTILQSLSGRKGLPHGVMADVLGFEQTTLSRLLKPLIKRELVRLEPNPNDKRGRMVILTAQGENTFAKAKTLWQTEHDKSLNQVDDHDWETVKRILHTLSDI